MPGRLDLHIDEPGGQDLSKGPYPITAVLRGALDFVLAPNVADYRDAGHSAQGLLQVADYVCTIERASIAYDRGSQSRTHERFFGTRRDFRQSYVKQLASKRLPQQSGAVAPGGSRPLHMAIIGIAGVDRRASDVKTRGSARDCESDPALFFIGNLPFVAPPKKLPFSKY